MWPFEDVGNLYTTTKIVYMSPQFADMIDFGVSFEPGTGTMGRARAATTTHGRGHHGSRQHRNRQQRYRVRRFVGNQRVTAKPLVAATRFDAVVRLRTAFGPVGVAFTVGGMVSGRVVYDGAAPRPAGRPSTTGWA